MIRFILHTSAAAGLVLVASPAWAAEFHVSPDGSGEECTRGAPCNLHTGASLTAPGDTVVLHDGIYKQGLSPPNSGTADAWITYQADQCAVPILEGDGEAAEVDENGDYPTGVYTTVSYIRFKGLVSRHWDSGFSNQWTGEGTTDSNGHLEYINCIGDGNHRTAFAMYSAGNFVVRECIAAHSGGSPTHSWSSGIQMYAVQGTADDNIVERSVSFENYDAQKNNDGSGFIVDEYTLGSTFLNNIAFGNGGSCMRLTRSANTRMLHFSCYHNGQNPTPNSPTDPGEFYFTEAYSRESSSVLNTLAAASGSPVDPQVFVLPPETGLRNNVTLDSGEATFFSDPEGVYPDFRPPASASALVEDQGTPDAGADVDIGFDPQCIVREAPDVPYAQSWWRYSVNYDYIRSIGGVASCFHPKQRTGGPDVGAYELSGEPHEVTQPGSCIPIVAPATGGTSGAGGTAGSGGTDGAGGDAAPGSGGASAGSATGGLASDLPAAGGTVSGVGGLSTGGTSSGPQSGQATPARGFCSLSGPAQSSRWFAFTFLLLGLLSLARRRQTRAPA